MTAPSALPERQRLPLSQRILPLLAVAIARVLVRLRPRRLSAVLDRICSGARPATQSEALAAREAVAAVSLRCAGEQGCLPRSVATMLLCRLRGTAPAWRIGVRTMPFSAHAWVEVGEEPVGELYPAGYYEPLTVLGADVLHAETPNGTVLLDGRSGRYFQLNPSGSEALRWLIDGDGEEPVGVVVLIEQLRGAGLGSLPRHGPPDPAG